jgi:hypothetical protein
VSEDFARFLQKKKKRKIHRPKTTQFLLSFVFGSPCRNSIIIALSGVEILPWVSAS